MKISITNLIMSLYRDLEDAKQGMDRAETAKQVNAHINYMRGKLSMIDNLVNIGINLTEREEDELGYAQMMILRKLYEASRYAFAKHADEMTEEEHAEIFETINRRINEAQQEINAYAERL